MQHFVLRQHSSTAIMDPVQPRAHTHSWCCGRRAASSYTGRLFCLTGLNAGGTCRVRSEQRLPKSSEGSPVAMGEAKK